MRDSETPSRVHYIQDVLWRYTGMAMLVWTVTRLNKDKDRP